MDRSSIIDAIDYRVNSAKTSDYKVWTIGITNDPDRRKGEHDNPKYWKYWGADSENDARHIENHFLDKDMKGDTGGGQNPTYVYIF